MLTFMPMIGFFKSLRELDDARLEKQRRDAKKLLVMLLGPKEERNHMACWMWSGFEYTLCVFGMSACSVWQNERGHREDDLAFQIHALLEGYPHDLAEPPWVGDLNFHRRTDRAVRRVR